MGTRWREDGMERRWWGESMQTARLEYTTKLSRDKFEPIFGDLALRKLPCNCFLGLFFLSQLTQLHQHHAGRCAAGFHTVVFPGPFRICSP